MRWDHGAIAGVVVFTPTPHRDDRGFFSRTFDAAVAREAGIDPDAFLQDSQSRSHRGVVRGLHLRLGAGEAKLVRCSYGAVVDVVVDLRPSSPTFLSVETFELDAESHRSVYLPAGCGHGWQALTEPADVCYRIDRLHDPAEDLTIRWDDPTLGVPWPLPVSGMSEKDRQAPGLDEVRGALGSAS
ncbi:dTDP-4-dehydrorhamnose 3,5-epimerase family protein [Jatrophihabitans sp. YIM 134969]